MQCPRETSLYIKNQQKCYIFYATIIKLISMSSFRINLFWYFIFKNFDFLISHFSFWWISILWKLKKNHIMDNIGLVTWGFSVLWFYFLENIKNIIVSLPEFCYYWHIFSQWAVWKEICCRSNRSKEKYICICSDLSPTLSDSQ